MSSEITTKQITDEQLKTNANVDRRIRKTRSALKSSLNVLLQKKNIKDISVKELTDLADVNRGTFYLHYKDVFDLLEQSELELLNELHHAIDELDVNDVKKDPSLLFEHVYTVCSENADFIRILLGRNGDMKFLNSLNTFVKEKCLHEWRPLIRLINIDNFDAFFSFLIGGCCSLLQYWFSTGMKQSPRELADITAEILNRTISD